MSNQTNDEQQGEEAKVTAQEANQPSPRDMTGLEKQILKDHEQRPFTELRLFADSFHGVQSERIRLENRLRSESVPSDTVKEILDSASELEKKVKKAMKASFRKASPLMVEWLKTDASVGIGEHLMARLMGAVGHPLVAIPHHWQGEGSERKLIVDEPYVRTRDQFKAICGFGDPTRKRRVGMSSEDAMKLGNPRAKMLTRLLAESTMKAVGSGAIGTSQGIAGTGSEDMVQVLVDAMVDPSEASSEEARDVLPMADGGAPTEEEKPKRVYERRRSPYRDVYDIWRGEYARREENKDEEKRPGWTIFHQHNAALRKVAQKILCDIYDLHMEDAKQQYPELVKTS